MTREIQVEVESPALLEKLAAAEARLVATEALRLEQWHLYKNAMGELKEAHARIEQLEEVLDELLAERALSKKEGA